MTGILKEERIGGQRLLLGDCIEVMPLLGRFNAVVTDPPYGLGAKLRIGGFAKWPLMKAKMAGATWDNDTAAAAIIAAIECSDSAIIWGGQYYALPPMGGWLIWDKIVRNFSSGHVEMAWTTLDQPTRAYNYAHGQLASEGKLHPTQKPLPLMEWCLGFLPKATTILDPFMGSGTTLVACQKLGRQGTGIELDPDYFAIACKRVDEATRQPDMFVQASQPAPTQEPLL